MKPISVSLDFKNDFSFFIKKAGYDRNEELELKDLIRSDFNRFGAWVTDTANVYRFCDRRWGGMPTVELCAGYLASHRIFFDDLEKIGILLLAKMCYDAHHKKSITQ